ncbi:glycosyltransferase [Cyanobium sp. Morenito 9A2]|uniref:glycosyltransferase n=1 Tax=Cyanobium sp. Morenito 9A2 TaxID=2823718 RepID=UPI0020CFB0AE|nr:glycosyltransferase [Cyanobium sp. Morenito 9A2]MCP9848257.1 glycosyltransferase [Cyanobium sp. Morenito 9A2]
MAAEALRLLVVSTPVGTLGSGKGGGVELTLASLVAGLLERGHGLTVLAASGSRLPAGCERARLWTCPGVDQPSWQHQRRDAPVQIPVNALLPRLWQRAVAEQAGFDALINLAYDWLPFWLTPQLATPLLHLVSMGSVAEATDAVIAEVARWDQRRLAFHTLTQAKDFQLPEPPVVVGNGFDLRAYAFCAAPEPLLGWVGRIAPEKGLEDAARAAALLGRRLAVWGLVEDPAYAAAVEASVSAGTIDWRGFLPTAQLQAELGRCAALLNTPKWNEAYGNVVVEAMACGVPVVAYRRGGPGELVQPGVNGQLVPPDDVPALAAAVAGAEALDRRGCRTWVERSCSRAAFAERLERWLLAALGR